jgi:predicted AlkP superfamily pyrophosphatase or phosphodiesterase
VSHGVQAEYVEPIFPSLSFPSWTTIATGLYPENHNILGNYIVDYNSDTSEETVFQLKDNSTLSPHWWTYAEPIWTTATKNNLKVFMANWARCDVPIEGLLPTECTGYTYQDINTGFRDDLSTAVKRLKNGFSLAMVIINTINWARDW